MTIQEKYRSLLEEIKTATNNDDTWFNYLNGDLEIGDDVLQNEEINFLGETQILPAMPFNDDNAFSLLTMRFNNTTLKMTSAWENVFTQNVRGLYFVGFSSGYMSETRFAINYGLKARSIDDVNHDVYPRTNLYLNGEYAGGSSTQIVRELGLGTAIYFNDNLPHQKNSISLKIDKLKCPLVIVSNGPEAEKYGIPDTHLSALYNNCNSIDEFEEYNAQYAQEFKHWCINYDIGEDEGPKDKLWFYDYNLSLINEITGGIYNTVNKKAKFKLLNDGDKVRFVKLADKRYQLVFNCEEVALLNDVTGDYTIVNVNTLIDEIAKGKVTINNIKYLGDIYTNIPFVENFDDEEDESGNFISDEEFNYTGEKWDGKLTGRSYRAVHNIYYVTEEELLDIASVLYASDQNFVNTLKNGLWMYQENPVNCMISIIYSPVNMKSYSNGSGKNKRLKFGNFVYNGELSEVPRIAYETLSASGKLVTNYRGRILPTYNDFRDYTNIAYSIYLPYYGIVKLDSNIVNKSFRIETSMDIYQAILKYWIFSDEILIGEYECNVGINMPLVGSNWVTSSAEKMTGAVESALSLAGTVAGGPSLGRTISGASELFTGIQAQFKDNSVSVAGTTSGKFNYNDDNSIILILEETQSIKPLNLNELYGKPCYFMSQLSNLSGFAMVSDVRIETKATQSELDEIVALLSQGVIF